MFKGLRFQKRISILPGVRINLSKSGASASLGPRGADVNIGPHGVTTNAGIPGTGLSYRQKVGAGGKTWLAVLALMAGLGVWAFQHWTKIEDGRRAGESCGDSHDACKHDKRHRPLCASRWRSNSCRTKGFC